MVHAIIGCKLYCKTIREGWRVVDQTPDENNKLFFLML